MNIDPEIQAELNRYQPRWYQQRLHDAIFNKGYKKLLYILPRRAGKDYAAWHCAIWQCLLEPCTVYYMLPTFAQAKRVIWDALDNSGLKFLDMIPRKLIYKKHEQDLKITFINSSVLQLAGSDTYDRLVGSNPRAIIFSEWALANPEAYTYLRPILVANDGWSCFISTPRSKNHLYRMYEVAQNDPEWYCEKLTIEDTQHISREDIQREVAEGLISEHKIRQEYYTDFNTGQESTIYGKYLMRAEQEGRITHVPYEQGSPVYTAWDIGRNDHTAIIFFQVIGKIICVIDYYEKRFENLEHFVRVLEEKEYRYGTHFFPHDMQVTEYAGPKLTRLQKVQQYGLKAKIVNRNPTSNQVIPLEDGIEIARSNFHKLWIDEGKCGDLIKCLDNYHRAYDEKTDMFSAKPVHDRYSNGADAFRYMMMSLAYINTNNSTPEELERRYQEARYGKQITVPKPFHHPIRPPNKYTPQGFNQW